MIRFNIAICAEQRRKVIVRGKVSFKALGHFVRMEEKCLTIIVYELAGAHLDTKTTKLQIKRKQKQHRKMRFVVLFRMLHRF